LGKKPKVDQWPEEVCRAWVDVFELLQEEHRQEQGNMNGFFEQNVGFFPPAVGLYIDANARARREHLKNEWKAERARREETGELRQMWGKESANEIEPEVEVDCTIN